MKMKILAICASPRKGDSYSTLETIKENNQDIDLKILMLNELNLKDCIGCYACNSKGEEYCPLKDDRDIIINHMKKADGVIFVSPTYVYHSTALMKRFIERTGFFGHRPIFFDKYAMVIGTCKGFGAKEVTKYMKGIFTSYGFNVASSLELQITTNSAREQKYNKDLIVKAFNIFIEDMKNKRRKTPSIMEVVMFNMLKYVSEVRKDHMSADYEYYKEKNNFYYKTKIPFFKEFIAKQEIKKFKKDLKENR